MIDGVMRASAVASALATAVRFKNALAVMPDETCANPLVGKRRRTADHEVGGTERRVLADEDLARVLQFVDDAIDVVVVDRDLEMLRCIPVGDRDRLVERPDDDTSSVGAQRRPGGRGADVGEIGELRRQLGVGRVGEVGRRGDQHDRRIGAVLGLDEQVGREPDRVGGAVGDHEALGGPEQHHRRDAVALHLDLGDGDRRRSGADDLAHLGDRLRAEAQRGDAGRTVDTEHVAQAELAADDEHGRIDLAAATRNRRHDERQLRHPGDDRRHRQLVGDARIAGLARWREQTRR